MRAVLLLVMFFSYGFSKTYDLVEVYKLAYLNSDSFKIASLKVNSSNEEIEKSFSSFYPKVNMDTEFLKLNEYPVIVEGVETEKRRKRRDITFNIDQVIYDRSKYLDYKIVQNNFFQSEKEKKKEYQQLISNVVKYYFETLYKSKQIELTSQKLKRFEKIVERASMKYKMGFISKADYLEAKSERDELFTQKLQLELDYKISKSFLEKMTGKKISSIKKNIELIDFDMNLLTKYDGNLDFQIQKLKLEKSKLNQDLKISSYEPKITLNYEHKRNDIPASENSRKLTFLIKFNIFNGFYDLNSYQQARIQKLMEEKALNKMVKDVKQDIVNRVEKVKTYFKIIQSYPQILETKRFSLEGMREKFNVGTKSIIDLLDEENKYFEKLNKFTEYKYQFFLEYTSLNQYTSSLNEEFLNKVNRYLYE